MTWPVLHGTVKEIHMDAEGNKWIKAKLDDTGQEVTVSIEDERAFSKLAAVPRIALTVKPSKG